MSIPRFGQDEALSRLLADYERRLRNLERSAQGNLTLLDAAGDVAAELNADGITIYDGNTVEAILDGDGIRSGDYVAGTSGYKLGADSEVNSLSIRGGAVQAMGIVVGSDGDTQVVGTSITDITSCSVVVPSWTQNAVIFPVARWQIPNTSGADKNVTCRLYYDDGDGSWTQADVGTISADNGYTRPFLLTEPQYISLNGTTLQTKMAASVSSGSLTITGVIDMLVVYLRD